MTVWVLDDFTGTVDACFDVLAAAVPVDEAGASGSTLVECRMGAAETARTAFLRDQAGNLYVRAVPLLLLQQSQLGPQNGEFSCWDVRENLLPADRAAETALARLECMVSPPLRDDVSRPRVKVWSMVPIDSPVTDFADDVLCWELNRYWSNTLEGGAVYVPCLIEG